MRTCRSCRRIDRQEGFALPAAVAVIVLLGILVTGGFFMARQESRVGVANGRAQTAFYLAEEGAVNVLSAWQPAVYGRLSNWDSVMVSDTTSDAIVDVNVTKMTQYLYYLEATSRLTAGSAVFGEASRSVGIIARIFTLDLDVPGALTTRGRSDVRGAALINGFDLDPPGWIGLCDEIDSDDKPGILTDNASTVSGDNIFGDPPVARDPNLEQNYFTTYGGLTWEELTAMATWTFPGGNFNNPQPTVHADGSCNYADPMNWGDPENPNGPCGFYFPMIHIEGNANIQSGGRGQGILLIDGDADVRGDFLWHGVVIVQGRFQTEGGGPRVLGGVLAANADLDNQKFVGSSVVQNSTCAVEQALLNNPNLARPRPLDQRSWVDLSALQHGS